ncbi:putative Signal transduction histidine kinase [Vibrio nigripulchritudo MADA3029]|uniref:Hpt domain-containing protein n=1 Tax=Vibrio nigripulchritudo TaxID=28173 RepID=UPI0003B220BD|nr:Hpt domain-containing protein [Vibrio nigripulchritudo]CCN47954.1 putative Signal transduction histidine kinase [Vibrio nigripulchritudo MADA3020]CCN52721.1 putative Signal transduction histidine kinase [Vibrio nigripulchritudo MADA3021]CCN59249.1 putative Signal transduction histidine kinase [Vibrio nigripulchritudo MADA3029]
MEESSIRNRRYIIVAFLLVWGVISSILYFQHIQLRKEADSLGLLSNQIEEFRYTLSFPDPIRAQHIEQLSLNLELIKSVKVQIESESEHGIWSPETAQLVYLSDRFIERAENYLTVALDIRGLSEQILNTKNSQGTPKELVALYDELGAYLFSSFYADSNLNPPNYMTLESIMLRSERFDSPYKNQIQGLLSKASLILAEHAQLSYVTEEILKHSVVREIGMVRTEFQHVAQRMFTISLVLSGVFLLAIGWIGFNRVAAPQHTEAQSTERPSSNIPGSTSKETQTAPVKQEQPVKLEEPVEVTQEPEPIQEPPVMESPEPVPTNSRGFDPEMMLETFDNDEESVLMVLNVFLQDHSEDVNKLKEALNQDSEQAHRIAHSLKGVAGNLGANALKDITANIEHGLKQGSKPSESDMVALEQSLKTTIDDVESYLGTVNAV